MKQFPSAGHVQQVVSGGFLLAVVILQATLARMRARAIEAADPNPAAGNSNAAPR